MYHDVETHMHTHRQTLQRLDRLNNARFLEKYWYKYAEQSETMGI